MVAAYDDKHTTLTNNLQVQLLLTWRKKNDLSRACSLVIKLPAMWTVRRRGRSGQVHLVSSILNPQREERHKEFGPLMPPHLLKALNIRRSFVDSRRKHFSLLKPFSHSVIAGKTVASSCPLPRPTSSFLFCDLRSHRGAMTTLRASASLLSIVFVLLICHASAECTLLRLPFSFSFTILWSSEDSWTSSHLSQAPSLALAKTVS